MSDAASSLIILEALLEEFASRLISSEKKELNIFHRAKIRY